SEEQKRRWLPAMATLDKLGAFALTEPQHGSDSVALETSARRDGDEWVINGAKKWIGNGTIADVIVVWARDNADRQVKGFLVEKDKLVKMLAEVCSMQLYCLRLGRLIEEGKLTDTIAAIAKMNNTRKARQVILEARDLLGGNGILLDFHVMRHLADIEAIHTYEGTETIQTLIVGRDITGVGAFT